MDIRLLVGIFSEVMVAIWLPFIANWRRRHGLDRYSRRTHNWLIVAGELASGAIVCEAAMPLIQSSGIAAWASVATSAGIALLLAAMAILVALLVTSLRNGAGDTRLSP